MTTKCLFTTVVLCAHVLLASAQAQNSIFEHETPVTWLGIDFTGALFIGDSDKFKRDTVVYEFMESVNRLMVDEPHKYNIPGVFDKAIVENAIDITLDHNTAIKAEALRSVSNRDFFHLTPEIIGAIVVRHDFAGMDGIGLMFNVESFNKLTEKGPVWITFIDMKEKKVLLTERMIDSPGGFGLRNFWAGCIYGILKQIRKREYAAWKDKYYRG